MFPSMRLRLLALSFAALTLTSCASLTNLHAPSERIDVNAVACGAFSPITTTAQENATLSETTLRQIREHNAAWVALCRSSPR